MSHTNPTRGGRLVRPDPSKPRYPEAEIVAAAMDRLGLSVSIGLNELIAETRRLVSAVESLKPPRPPKVRWTVGQPQQEEG